MTNRLKEIKGRLSRATPGPWKWINIDGEFDYLANNEEVYFLDCAIIDDGSAGGEYNPGIDVNGPDAILIANAPSDIEWLIKRVEDLERVEKEWQQLVLREE